MFNMAIKIHIVFLYYYMDRTSHILGMPFSRMKKTLDQFSKSVNSSRLRKINTVFYCAGTI